MKRFTLILATVVCLLAVAPLNPAAAKDTWTSVRSRNFFLVGNASEKEIRQVATRLEQFRDVFSRLFTKIQFNSPVPTTVIVFKSDGSYRPFKPNPNVAGYFQTGEDVNYITLTTEAREDDPFSTIFHEYVHLLVNNTLGAAIPLWFNEGLAEYYSTFKMTDDRKVMLGKVISNHVFLLREQKLLPLRTLFAVDQRSPYYNEGRKMSVFYAESWALLHYLIQGSNGQHRAQLGTFLNLLGAGKPAEDAFKQTFQTDYETVEKELKEYVRRNTYAATAATFERRLEFDSEMQSAPITEAEAQFYLGDLLLHIRHLDDAEKHLQQSLALDPNLAMANASLGIVRARQGRFADAKQLLQRAVAADSRNYLAHYYYAYALSREGMDDSYIVRGYPAESAEIMRAELKKAIELAPGFPESYHLLAFVNLVTGEQLDDSITLLKRALALSPARQDINMMLAQIYLREQDFKAARQILEQIVRSNSEPRVQAQAQSLLNSVASMEEQIARYKAADSPNGPRPITAPQSEDKEPQPAPPVDEKAAMQRALEDVLRKPRDGEEQARGTLLRIDCSVKGAVFSVKAGDRIFKLHSNDFASVEFTTYTTEINGRISCGPRNPANPVIITYRPVKDTRAKIDGEVVAIEFVPKDFELKQ